MEEGGKDRVGEGGRERKRETENGVGFSKFKVHFLILPKQSTSQGPSIQTAELMVTIFIHTTTA